MAIATVSVLHGKGFWGEAMYSTIIIRAGDESNGTLAQQCHSRLNGSQH